MVSRRQIAAAGFLAVAFLLATHAPFFHLPYFWDEMGQFVPASLDLYHSGALIPYSTIPNVHPPGLMAFLTGVWSIFGYSVAATRIAMLMLAAAGLVLTFLVTQDLAGSEMPGAGLCAAGLLALHPLFFSQAMMAQLDMPAMVLFALAFWLFIKERIVLSALVCVALVLVKETGIVAPVVFSVWLAKERRWRDCTWFLLPVPALFSWLVLLHKSTGHWFGNAEFTEYNVYYPLHPVRLALAILRRFYFLFVANGNVIGLAALVFVRRAGIFQTRAWRVAALLTAAHVVVISIAGGAVLDRYLLPVFPLAFAAFATALGHLARPFRTVGAAAFVALLLAGIFINPPYPFPLENNLAWTAFVNLELQAAQFAEQTFPHDTIATSFPMGGALRRPEFGFVSHALKVKEVSDFTPRSIESLQGSGARMLIYYNVLWDPLDLFGSRAGGSFVQRFYGYHPQASGHDVERILNAHLVREWTQAGFSMQCYEIGSR